MPGITIIREVNCNESTPSLVDRARLATGLTSSVPCRMQISVWLAFAPYEYGRDDHDYTEMGTRVVGPVPEEQGELVIQQLQEAFNAGGFHVSIGDAADD